MINSLKILHLEDVPDDAELVSRHLKKAGFNGEILHVDTRSAFVAALSNYKPDIILSDHSLPSFDSLEALSIVKQNGLEIPFILVTATVSEEYAVSIIKEGAEDYILKDRLHRLPSAIEKAVEKIKTATELASQQMIQQRLVIETSIQVQERERDQLAKELHDNVNQILATAKLYVKMAKATNGSRIDLLQKSDETIGLAISEIRKLSHKLITPTVGSTGLVGLIQELISDIEAATYLKFRFTLNDFKEEELNNNINLMFYRIVQEQINNIIKHAFAETVAIELSAIEGQLRLSIEDDGKGFDLKDKTPRGIGLNNIKNRVSFHHGITKIISSPGMGCRLEVSIPVLEKLLVHT